MKRTRTQPLTRQQLQYSLKWTAQLLSALHKCIKSLDAEVRSSPVKAPHVDKALLRSPGRASCPFDYTVCGRAIEPLVTLDDVADALKAVEGFVKRLPKHVPKR